jgi:L-alanine-DL-glutamate epimerase-like enolase superfamily enzyme
VNGVNTHRPDATVERIEVGAYRIPTDAPEADGTIEWDSTTLVVVHAHGGGQVGMGYGFADEATATLIKGKLAKEVQGKDALAVPECWAAMLHAIRNLGRPGISSMAVACVDNALWDLKAKLLGVSLVDIWGRMRTRIPIYGSGGFTSYSIERLQEQLGDWAAAGIKWVKMKIGTDASADLKRVMAARGAVGKDVELFVDANGAYSRKQALKFAHEFADLGVTWFEEPVSSDDLDGLRLLRDQGPPGMAITAGEYGYDLPYFHRMLAAGAVDVLQADATRCAGISGFLQVGALCAAHCIPLSSHTAPLLHMHPCCALGPAVHMEYFHDHVRILQMLFDGVTEPKEGTLEPDLSRPGLGLEFKRADAARYAL